MDKRIIAVAASFAVMVLAGAQSAAASQCTSACDTTYGQCDRNGGQDCLPRWGQCKRACSPPPAVTPAKAVTPVATAKTVTTAKVTKVAAATKTKKN
jgi:hypothetical protein